jgi:predicted secreted protein
MIERTGRRLLQVFLLWISLLVSLSLAAAQDSAEGTGTPVGAKKSATTTPGAKPTALRTKVCAACIHGHMEFLASDALRGRGSGTHDELVAATYIAAQLRAYGIAPAFEDGYLQKATLVEPKFKAAPSLTFSEPAAGAQSGKQISWAHGKEILALYLTQPDFNGPLAHMDSESADAKVPKGSVVLISGNNDEKVQAAVSSAASQGAAGMLVLPSPNAKAHWDARGQKLPTLASRLQGSSGNELGLGNFNIVALNDDAFNTVAKLPDGTTMKFSGEMALVENTNTWNAVGILRGRDPVLGKQVILLSAHLDHLGIGRPVNGDDIYNGADDDASGVTAVLELARVLGSGPKPKRTVIFALFGSEEFGGLGSTYFREHPPVPLTDIVANLEFEMIGRPDPKYPKDSMWLSGWERSNLGPALALHGAKLVPDKRPEEHFFQRSDNFVLATKGVVAQTASSFGLHSEYHQPNDDLAHIDFTHMTTAIGSLIAPVEWLVNTSFKPAWVKGGRP